MGWYLRKSFGAGPFRLNLSKSGLGYSFGVRGARIGVNTRGTYVRLGRGGIYYQKYLDTSSSGQPTPTQLAPTPVPSETLTPIVTADAAVLADSSAAELLSEIQEKNAKVKIATVAAIASGGALMAMLAAGGPVWVCVTFVVVAALLHFESQALDIERKRVSLKFELDKGVMSDFAGLLGACTQLSSASSLWRLTAQDRCLDPKYHAGAGTLIARKGASLAVRGPDGVETNLAVWRLNVGEQTLYFLPDRLLIEQGGRFGAVEYTDLVVEDITSRFVEEGSVPGDTRVVDQTWRYTNKGGGPDRRFATNPQIPVVLYGEVHLRSTSGLHIIVQVSDPSKAEKFASGLRTFVQTRHTCALSAHQ